MRTMTLERSGGRAPDGRDLKDEAPPAVRVQLTCPCCDSVFMQPIEKKKAICHRCGNIWPWERELRLRTRTMKNGGVAR